MNSSIAPNTRHQQQRRRGFTLVELLVVIAIIAILAAIAYPSYTRYVTATRRSEGQRLLFLAAAQQEKFFTQCGWYASTFGTPLTCGAVGTGVLGIANTLPDVTHYSLATPIVSVAGAGMTIANSFQLTATALSTQATQDTICGNLTLDSRGVKGRTGLDPQNICWRR